MKKLLAILCAVIMLAGLIPTSYASSISADEDLVEYDKSALDKLTVNGSISILDKLGNHGTDVSLAYSENNFDSQKEATHEFMETLLSLIKEGQEVCEHVVIEGEDFEENFSIEINFDKTEKSKVNRYEINIINNHIYARRYEDGTKHAIRSCDVNNIDAIIDFIFKAEANELSVFEKADITTKNDDTSSNESSTENNSNSSGIYYDESILDSLTANGEAEIRFLSKKYDINHGFGFSSNSLTEQKAAVENFLDELIKLIEKDGEQCSHNSYKTEGLNTYAYVSILLTEKANYNKFEIEIRDNHVEFFWRGDSVKNELTTTYDVGNIDEIREFLSNAYDDELAVLSGAANNNWNEDEEIWTINYDKKTLSIGSQKEEYDVKEKLEFDVKLDSSYEDTILTEIGKKGEKIHATIELLFTGTQYYILTLEGSRGSKQFYHEEKSYGFSGSTNHNLPFETIEVVNDNKMMYLNNSDTKWDFIYINGDASDGELEIELEYDYYSNQGSVKRIEAPNILKATNVKYSYYGDEKYLDSGRNMFTLFRLPDKEEYITQVQQEMKEESEKETQNPERVITKYKGIDDDMMLGYYINFIAEIPLDFSNGFTPDWYDNLGSNVTATLIGFTGTIDGEDDRHFTMMKLSGDKGDMWFARN